jgi:hypothetical protein
MQDVKSYGRVSVTASSTVGTRCVDSQESLTGEDRLELSGTTKEVTERNNTDHILDRLINWQYLLPPIKLFYILP